MKCQSCGRQSETKYCGNCTDENGNLKSFDEIVDNLSKYFVETQGFDPEAAKSAAIGVMSRQPAWEQKIEKEQQSKAGKLRLSFALTALVVAITSGGVVYWITAPKRVASLVTYENIPRKTISPFDEIVEKEINGLQVFEMRCPGDQRIYHLSDNIMTFESLEGTKNSKNYALFNINLKTMQGFPFIPESIQTRNIMMDSDLRVIDQKTSEQASRCWIYKPDDGKLYPIKDYLLGYNSMYYTYRDYINSRDYAIEIDTGKKILLPFSQRARFLEKSTIFYDYTNILLTSDKNYHLFDLLSNKITNLPVSSSFEVIGGSDKHKLMKDETAWYSDTADKSLYVLNIPAQKLVKIDDDFIGTPILSEGSGDADVMVFYQRQNPETRVITTYKKSIFRPGEPPVVVDLNGITIYPIHATKTNLVYSTRANYASGHDGKQVDEEKALTDLWVRDLLSGKDYQLESSGVKSVIVSESYITWVKWQGVESDQYFNICIAQIIPQRIDSNQYDSGDKQPFDNIMKTHHGNLEISEMMCEGSQSFFGAQNSIYGARYEGYELVRDRDVESFTMTKGDLINIFQNEATNRGYAAQYLFDLGTESGVKLSRGNARLKGFLDDHEMSLKWQDYDSLINNMSMNMYDYSDGTFKSVGPNTIPKAMSLKAVPKGNQTVIIYNDTKTDHELMTVDCLIEKVFIAPPRDNNNMIFTVKLYTEKYVDQYDYFYLDTRNAKAIALGKNINILDSNDRFVLIKPDVMEMSSLKLFDKQTGKLIDIKPNLKPMIGDLGNCKINDATDPKDLMFVWPYPEQNGSNVMYKIAYSKLSDIETRPTITKTISNTGNTYLTWACGNWIFFTNTALSVLTVPTTLYGLNTATGEVVEVDGHFTGTISRVGNTLCWITDRGYPGHQFTNICFAKIK